MTGYLARDFLVPRTFIFSCNAEALVVQSTLPETKIAFLNSTASPTLSPIYYLNADRDIFCITQDNSNVATFSYQSNQGYLSIDNLQPNKISLGGEGTFSYSNDTIFLGLSHCNVSLAALRYDTHKAESHLDVFGSVHATGTVFASNLTIYGSSIIIDATTSNSEQVVIRNEGTGPALSVSQFGETPVAVFYDESNLSFIIADGGYVGINTPSPAQPLDVNGNATIAGNLGIGIANPTATLDILGNLQISGTILQNGSNYFDAISDWRRDASSNLYYTAANVGIGTTFPTKTLDINGDIRYTHQLFSTTTTLPPFSIASTQQVNNLNVEYLGGYNESDIRSVTNLIGTVQVNQGGTGSNYLSPNRLLVANDQGTAVTTPANLYWDPASQRLGIHTTSPPATLSIAGDIFLSHTLSFPEFVAISAASNAIQLDQLRVASNLGIGIACNIPVSLYLNTKDALRLPSGTTLERPLPEPGYIRYNSTTTQFEGYTSSNQWESLSRLQNPDATTSIFPDTTLRFTTSNLLRAVLDQHGNLGIGTSLPLVSLDIATKTDALALPKGTTAQRPPPFPGTIRYNQETDQFEGYTTDWTILSGLRSPDLATYIVATNASNIEFYTANQQQAILDSQGKLGIGTTLPQAQLHLTHDLLANDITTSNYTILQNFNYTPDGTAIRTHYQINPGRCNITLTTPTSNFSLLVNGLYAFPPENIDLHIDGSKYYTFTTAYTLQTQTTLVEISLNSPALSNQVVDILAWPQYLNPNALLQPGYVIQDVINNSYWDLTLPTSNISYSTGNVGIGTTHLPAKFFVQGNTFLNGTVGVGTQTVPSPTGLHVFNGPLRAQGSVVESPQGFDRLDLGVQNNTPRIVFENASVSSDQVYQIDVENEAGSGTFRWYVPGNTLLQLNTNSFRVAPNTYLGSASSTPLNTLDIANNAAIGTYAATETAPNNSLIVSGNIGIGTTYPRQALEVTQQSIFLGNVGVGTTLPRASLEVNDVLYVAGQLGIHTTTPLAPLHINANTYTSGNIGFGTQPTTPIDLWLTQEPSLTQDAIRLTTTTHDISTADITATAITMRMIEPTGDLLLTPMARIAYGNRHGTNLYGAGYENNGVLMFDTASAGTLGTRMLLAATGVGIGTTLPRSRLDIEGTTRATDLNVLGNVGIGTTTPLNNLNLHVQGTSYISQALGIGSSTPQTLLDVAGSAFLTGNLGIGTLARAALDITGTTLIGGNLGIGTLTPRHELDLLGTALVSQAIGVNTTSPLQPLHIQGNAYISGNIGIGTTQPLAALDLDHHTLLAGNIGIGTTQPTAVRLDVNGDAKVTRLGVNVQPPRATLDINGNAIFSTNVGINTLTPAHPLHIHSSDRILTVHDGKTCITKGLATTATTDLEIQTSDPSTYSGILIKNDGNVYPTGAMRIHAHHFNNNTSVAYAANIGLARYNNNAIIAAQTPLGAIHFGGNHTTTAQANIAYTASIRALAETAFTNSSNASTALAFYTSSNAYQFIDPTATFPEEVMRLTANQRVGIHTTLPDALLTIQASTQATLPLAVHASTAILLPVGSNTDRPQGQLGLIRYNTEYQQFEGFGGGNSWGSLGGVRSIAGDTYILAEYTPGNNDQSLHFYTANNENMILNPSGNLGIGTLTPHQRLVVEGNALVSGSMTTSNLTVLGTVTFNSVASNLEEVVIVNHGTGPALSVTQTGEEPIAVFYDGDGLASNQVVTIANNGNVGIGTTTPAYGLHVYRDVAFGKGLGSNQGDYGCYYLQRSWDTPSTNHIISYPDYCIGDDSAGTLHIQVKGPLKLGTISVSFLKAAQELDLFSIYYHKNTALTTMDVSVYQTSNILVQTDNDCKVAWQASGAT
jgi:hypothetical protein